MNDEGQLISAKGGPAGPLRKMEPVEDGKEEGRDVDDQRVIEGGHAIEKVSRCPLVNSAWSPAGSER